MNLVVALLVGMAYAAETIVSPLPDPLPFEYPQEEPLVSFGALPVPAAAQSPTVLGVTTDETPTQPQTPTPTPSQTRATNKSAITIAVLGDSMVDTLGPGVPHLADRLARLYPATSFRILNYGAGGTNIDYGIERLTNDYSYVGNHVPSLLSQQPDLVVIESFGYNPYPFDEGVMERHWLALATMVDRIRASLPGAKIVIAATIAPNWNVFGDGAPFISMSPEGKRQKVETIKKYLENAVRFAQSQKLPLADAFHPSLDSQGNGKLAYINPGDHIHYSDAGRQFFAGVVANAIVSHKLLE